jgi:dihydrofolate reductase
MKKILIVAASDNGVIGINNTLPWHLPADLAHFKQHTMGKPIIMGRKTFESLPKLLPGRQHIVISRNEHISLPEGVLAFQALNEAFDYLEKEKQETCFLIGGAGLFKEGAQFADLLYLTRVHAQIEGDVFLDFFDKEDWFILAQEPHLADEKNKYDYTFEIWEPKKP